MKLSHLRDVLAIVEYGSLRAAGRHLGVTQPAISRSLREIENELGVMLFERHSKGVRLTRMGNAFVQRAMAIQSELQRATEEIEQLKGHTTGQASVALSSAASIALLPKTLSYFRKKHPGAIVKVAEGLFQSFEQDIARGKLDFFVGPIDGTLTPTQLSVEPLFANTRLVVARKGHPLSNATSVEDLKNAQWIRPSLSSRNNEANFECWFEERGLPRPDVVMHSRSSLNTILALTSSDLLTILPRQWLEFPLTTDAVQALSGIPPLPSAPISIVRRNDLPLTPLAEHLYDQFRRVAALYSAA